MATFRFTAGPWNIHEGNETFGPGHRKSIPLEEKMKKYAEIGLAGMQFHDDDAVPDMNNMTEKQIIDYAKDVKAIAGALGYFANSRGLDIERVGIRASESTGEAEVALWGRPGPFPRAQAAKIVGDAVKASSIVRVMQKGPAKARKIAGDRKSVV